MLLIIAHHHDREAAWLYQQLLKTAVIPVKFLVPETLGLDYKISLNLSTKNRLANSVCWFDNGQTILNTAIHWVINRLSYIDPPIWNHCNLTEKQYATNELNAFFAAFIHSFSCPISNPIKNGSLYQNLWLPKCIAKFKKAGINPTASLLKNGYPATKDFENPNRLLRFLCYKNSIYQPKNQAEKTDLKLLLADIKIGNVQDFTEFIFRQSKIRGKYELISASNTPYFSVYGSAIEQIIIHQYKTISHDFTIWNPERTPDAAINRCLPGIERAALCF